MVQIYSLLLTIAKWGHVVGEGPVSLSTGGHFTFHCAFDCQGVLCGGGGGGGGGGRCYCCGS